MALGTKINYNDPRYQRMVQQLGAMGQDKQAIFSTAMADSEWARNRQNLALDWYKIGTQKMKAEHDISMGQARLAETKRSNRVREQQAKDALKSGRRGMLFSTIGGLGKMGMGFLANRQEKQRSQERQSMLDKQAQLLDAQIAFFGGRGKKKRPSVGGKSSTKSFGGFTGLNSDLNAVSGLNFGNEFTQNKREMSFFGDGGFDY